MGRKSHAQALSIWANGERVGVWRIPARGPAELQYDEGWVASDLGRPLSLSLAFGALGVPLRGEPVQNYFDNLLPDHKEIRARIASKFKVDSDDPFELLKAIGRDCVGAIQLLAEDEEPGNVRTIQGTPMSDADIARLLRQTVSTRPAGAGDEDEVDDLRISLAGAQEKTALLLHNGQWLKPRGATPTTHILKLPLGLIGNGRVDMRTSVENEWLCSKVLEAFGLPVAHTEIRTFGDQKVLSVQRFDRRLSPDGRWYFRLPQEDFCQALGLPPRLKYEADGGPGMESISRILRGSEYAQGDVGLFLTAQILFWLLAATDGHAKNFSIHLEARGAYRMTPLYDVLSILPNVGNAPNQFNWHKAKLAMAAKGKNRHYLLKDIQRRHFNAMAPACGFFPNAEPILETIFARTPGVIENVRAMVPKDFPGHVAEAILRGLRRSVEALQAMPRD